MKLLGKELRRSLRRDRRRRVDKAGCEIEERLEKKDIVGAFNILKHWYKKFTGKAVKPTCEDIDATRQTYVELFKESREMEDELPFEFNYKGEKVNNEMPDEEEIRKAVLV